MKISLFITRKRAVVKNYSLCTGLVDVDSSFWKTTYRIRRIFRVHVCHLWSTWSGLEF